MNIKYDTYRAPFCEFSNMFNKLMLLYVDKYI